MTGLRTVARLSVLALVGVTLVACGDDEDAGSDGDDAANVLSIAASEYSFDLSGEPEAGALTIQVENNGKEIHELAMSRLVGDSTIDDVRAALDASGPDEEADFDGILEEDAVIDDLGAALFPGASLSISGSGIEPGSYVIMCFVPNAEGEPHFSLGMLNEFSITEGESTDAPEGDVTYTASDDGLDGPDTLDAGTTVFEMVNDSSINREIQVGKLADGATFEEANAFFAQFEQGPPTAEGLAGPDNPIEFFSFLFDAEQDRFVTVDLTPGTWVIGMPDPENEFEGSPEDDPYAVVIEVT
jgi:hypothetical protein